jgi:Putative Actinobacterial Holin-X, holin superfamily III
VADKSLPNQVTELWELVVAYVKQETVEPIKNLGRFVAFGVVGSLLLAVGLPTVVLAMLRAVQAESGDHLTGDLTFVPYLAAAALALLFAGMAAWGISRKKKKGAR